MARRATRRPVVAVPDGNQPTLMLLIASGLTVHVETVDTPRGERRVAHLKATCPTPPPWEPSTRRSPRTVSEVRACDATDWWPCSCLSVDDVARVDISEVALLRRTIDQRITSAGELYAALETARVQVARPAGDDLAALKTLAVLAARTPMQVAALVGAVVRNAPARSAA